MELNNAELFNRLFSGGAFALPYLLKFTHPEQETIYLVGNTSDIEFEGNVYKAASFEYIPPDQEGKGASLNISGIGNELIAFVEKADDKYRLYVTGVIAENGEIQKIRQYVHFYGTVSYTESMELTFELGRDDRLDMTFPPYKFDTETNKGNT